MKIGRMGWLFGIFFCYSAFIYIYLFILGTPELPAEFVGTDADPAQFLDEKQQKLVEEYAPIRDFFYFIGSPLEWLIYLFLLFSGLGWRFEQWAENKGKYLFIKCGLFTFFLSALGYILLFPYRYAAYYFSKEYGISAQSFGSWLRDGGIDFLLSWGMLTIGATVILYFMRKFERSWWFRTWIVLIPITVLIFYLQPVVIDPLYNEFKPLKDKELEEKILTLATKSRVPAEHVFEVDMSEKTNALNAYVTGIGSYSRIVLWDTTLNRLEQDEILFITAHEIGHYVEKHIYIGLISYIAASLFLFYLIAKIFRLLVKKYGKNFKITTSGSIQSLLLILFLFSALTFLVSPIENAVSRYQEMRADKYAIELTKDREAAVSAFQQLAKAGLSQVHPPTLVKWFRYTHPTILERIHFIKTHPLD